MSSFRSALVLAVVLAVVAPVGVGAAQGDRVTLTVTVVDQNGDPLSDVDVYATWNDGAGGPVNETTRANGQALLDVPEGADVRIHVDDDRYIRNSPYLVADATARSVEVPVSKSASATLTVRDTEGSPVENARVQLYRSGQFVTDQRTDADGVVETPTVEAGEYRVLTSKDGYFRNSTRLAVTGETAATLTLEEGSVLVTVTVTDDHFRSPRPLRNASVAVPSVGTVQTLSDGEATISVPVNGQYTLEVTKEGYETSRRQVRVRESPTSVDVAIRRTPRIELAPANERVVVGETVRLEATDEYGDPVVNATVTRNGETVGTTDDAGVATVPVDAAGNVTFTATAGDLSATASVEGIDPDATDTSTETATETTTPTDTETPTDGGGLVGESGPGFTPVTVVVALALLVVLALRRR
ncbi:carboxypeptidase regulatory-like domain-containing protein [Haloarcula pellucida]|uniref:PGF-CTERM sorting domain-containing protein n=1 Tax=Haloarcula pellucida TaxID=1427151 RepID=A0A830GNK0_9EURY|nr:carboxypeptidase regulatory-like domain-containing protein [Halomicroarcula pellucida]MBX0350085.1 carboxypeptidase regulatory-like domain-containing protein [Halomicroarcula pellucida]GGO00353.1 hypothetical protein GCM10009030_32870 [Halomicroarcula pellucida]